MLHCCRTAEFIEAYYDNLQKSQATSQSKMPIAVLLMNYQL